jgi:hypothetical protein
VERHEPRSKPSYFNRARRCVPPLADDEVLKKIAASISQYPAGGAEHLETA